MRFLSACIPALLMAERVAQREQKTVWGMVLSKNAYLYVSTTQALAETKTAPIAESRLFIGCGDRI